MIQSTCLFGTQAEVSLMFTRRFSDSMEGVKRRPSSPWIVTSRRLALCVVLLTSSCGKERIIDINERIHHDDFEYRGSFREDLFYRFNVFPVHVPPLRERIGDIPLLTRSFVEEFGGKFGRKIGRVPRSVMEVLQRYPWPGNIRELRNIIERAVIVSSGNALELDLPAAAPGESRSFSTLAPTEASQIRAALKQTGGQIKGAGGAASLIGINPSTLYTRMRKLGISPRDQRHEG
jgi:DNA-binding NtrC family response regulator